MKKTSKRVLSTLIACLFISLNLTTTITSAQQVLNEESAINDDRIISGEITINENFFPDENFLNYIKTSNFDLNQDGKLNQEELEKVTYIYVNMKQIKSLKGIEYFKNLKYLYAEMNYIETLDISKNTNLVVVHCNNNKLTSIKLPNQEENNVLENLEIYGNQLTDINLKNLKALSFLDIGDNYLTNLDLSDNSLVNGFIASNNFIEKITLPNNGEEYQWKTFLASQLYPKDKVKGYNLKWYLDEGKTQVLNPDETPVVKNVGQTLYTEYMPITYTIQFKPGTGEGQVKTQQFQYDKSQNLLKNEFNKLDYLFAGWKDDKGRIYADGAEVSNLTDIDGKIITLTATWKEKDYTGEKYTINLHNEENAIENIEGTYGNEIEISTKVDTKEGFDFIGWNYGDGDYSVYESGEKILITHPSQLNGNNTLDLYSVWKKQEFTVSFIDGQNNSKEIVQYNDKVNFPISPTKPGYTFEGWVNDSGEKWDEQRGVTSNMNLYAKYAPIKYYVSFDGNGADNEDVMNTIKLEIDYSEQAILPKSEYKKKFHTLEGWSTSPNGNVEFIDNDVVYELTTENNKTLTLYAVWKRNDSTITINNDSLDKVYDGNIISNPSVEKTGSSNEVIFTWYQMVGSEWKVIESAPVNVGKYKVVASVESDDNYYGASTEKEFSITKANSKVTITNDSLNKIYDGKKVSNPSVEKSGNDDEVIFIWYQKDGESWIELTTAPTDAGSYKVVASVAENNNYKGASDELCFEIEKAVPSYTVPSEIKATYGDTLKDIKLPEGFTWQDDVSTEVGNVGINKFKIIYTPEDKVNYEVIKDIEIKVEVVQAENEWIKEPSIQGWLYGVENNEPIAESKFGKVVFMYSSTKDGTYTNTIPTEVGKWYMKAIVEGNENYTGLEKIVSFVIEKSEVSVNEISISNGNTETNNFKYGDKIIIKVKIEFVPESIISKLREMISGNRKVALFANGIQVTEPQVAVNGKELTFVYDTTNGLINPTGEVVLTVSYIENNNAGTAISHFKINLDKKSIESEDIKVPEISKDTNLDDLQIKDGDIILKQGVDYDITTSKNGNIVTAVITFKGNYSGTITKTYKVEDENQSIDENKPEIDNDTDLDKENNLVTDSDDNNINFDKENISGIDSTNNSTTSNKENNLEIDSTNNSINSNKENNLATDSTNKSTNSNEENKLETNTLDSNVDLDKEDNSVTESVSTGSAKSIGICISIFVLAVGVFTVIIKSKKDNMKNNK